MMNGFNGDPLAPSFNTRLVIDSERFRTLDRRQSYYDCTQHDWKRFDWEGRMIRPGSYFDQNQTNNEQASFWVPFKLRRPGNPYRLAKVIVDSFTAMLLGDQRWPNLRSPGDDDTQDFAEALVEAADIPSKFLRARSIGGASGSVGLSWCFLDGIPIVDVHNSKHITIHEWVNRDKLTVKHATELYRYPVDEMDPDNNKKMRRNWYWHRRDWTMDADVVFVDQPYKHGEEPEWIVDTDKSIQHQDNVCHFIWVQNIPSDDIDGTPDIEALWENFDTLDIINSVIARGAICNLDPTLVLGMDADQISRMGISKGSDNSLAVGEAGSASYLELSGSSITVGLSLVDNIRKRILEVAQCVLADPTEIAASGISSVALKAIYAPMIARVEVLRQQYGKALKNLVEQMVTIAQIRYSEVVTVVDDNGNESEGTYMLSIPPRITEESVKDDEGKEVDTISVATDRIPGKGTLVNLEWGPYFTPTPADQQSLITSLQIATGAKAFMSVQTAAEITAAAFNRKPSDELKRFTAEKDAHSAENAQMFGADMGGQVDSQDGLPVGASQVGAPHVDKLDALQLTSTDIATVVKVNQALQLKFGLPALTKRDGTLDPDGELTIAAYKAKIATTIAAGANADKGTVGVSTPADADAPKQFGG